MSAKNSNVSAPTDDDHYLICSGRPPEVALVMAQAASFLVLNSALPKMSISVGMMLASITACLIGGCK